MFLIFKLFTCFSFDWRFSSFKIVHFKNVTLIFKNYLRKWLNYFELISFFVKFLNGLLFHSIFHTQSPINKLLKFSFSLSSILLVWFVWIVWILLKILQHFLITFIYYFYDFLNLYYFLLLILWRSRIAALQSFKSFDSSLLKYIFNRYGFYFTSLLYYSSTLYSMFFGINQCIWHIPFLLYLLDFWFILLHFILLHSYYIYSETGALSATYNFRFPIFF